MKQKPSKKENQLVFKYFIAGTVGMIAGAIVLLTFKKLGWSENASTGILFLPWMIAGVMMIPAAYRQGLKDGQKNNFANQSSDPT